jgi:hypothetical protein
MGLMLMSCPPKIAPGPWTTPGRLHQSQIMYMALGSCLHARSALRVAGPVNNNNNNNNNNNRRLRRAVCRGPSVPARARLQARTQQSRIRASPYSCRKSTQL